MLILSIVFFSLSIISFLIFTITVFIFPAYKNIAIGSFILTLLFLFPGIILFMVNNTLFDCRDKRNEIDRILESDTEFLVTDDFISYVLECLD